MHFWQVVSRAREVTVMSSMMTIPQIVFRLPGRA